MKRILSSFMTLVLLLSMAVSAVPARALSTNLIANPSAETADATGALPLNWTANSWGTNTATTSYSLDAHTGTHSLYAAVTAYTNGDVKWIPDDVAIASNQSYTYSSYYKSSIATELDVRYTDSSGNATFAYVGSVPASATWQAVSMNFTTPAVVSKASVMHILPTVGWLQTDDFSLTTTPVVTTPTVATGAVSQVTASSSTIAGTVTAPSGPLTCRFEYGTTTAYGAQTADQTVTAGTTPITITANLAGLTAGAVYNYRLSCGSASPMTVGANATFTTLTPITPLPPADGNLIINPSLETANGAGPANWQSNAWGTNNASFVYSSTGHTGSRSGTVTIGTYTSGDAKWFADPTVVVPGKTYSYSDWYQSAVATRLVAAFSNSTGTTTYAELGGIAASSAWTQYSTTLTVPASATNVTVYHLLDKAGSLTIDDASITATPIDTGLIPNSSLETAAGTVPSNWTSGKWGTNTANFQYMNEGHTGTRSAKVTVSGYASGDAKWFYNPITSLVKGKQYRWTTWYKTNTHPQAVAMFIRADGSEEFFGMPQPFPTATSATTWTQYSDTFIVPQDAVSVTNFLFIAGNGWVQVDDQSLTNYQPTGWNRPLVSLTFDDGYEENLITALPIMNQFGFKSTQCYETTDLKIDPIAAKKTLTTFMSSGHEICSHTVTHPFLTTLTTAQVDTELSDSKNYLQSLTGTPVVDFASPYGDYNQSVNTEIKKYYQSHRTVDEGYNSKDNFNAYRLRVQNMTPATSLAQYQAWIAQAQATNTWLILVYHDVTSLNPSPYGSYTTDFQKQMTALKASGVTVKTYKAALAEVMLQR